VIHDKARQWGHDGVRPPDAVQRGVKDASLERASHPKDTGE